VKKPHLLAVEAGPEAFAPLVEAAAAAGLRVGWLDLAPADPPAALAPAAELPLLRAVAVGGGRSVAVKPLAGEPVLRDLLREHFLGCRLVLVRGGSGGARLAPAGEGWRVEEEDGSRDLTTEQLLGRLRGPAG